MGKLSKLLMLARIAQDVRGGRGGHGSGHGNHRGYHRPPAPYGHGLKGALIQRILHKLLGRRY
jgi:hypothetical protein